MEIESEGTYGLDMVHRRQRGEGAAKKSLLEAGISFRLISFHSQTARARMRAKSNEEIDKSVFRSDKSFL